MGRPNAKKEFSKLEAISPEQQTFLNDIIKQALGPMQQAQKGYAQFLPGGGGGEAIAKQAQQRYQQQTVPSIMNAFGSGGKGSSALNQALASSAANLNTDLAAQLAQMQLQAATGAGQLGLGQANLALGTQPFGYQQRSNPFWQDLTLALTAAGGQAAAGWLGKK